MADIYRVQVNVLDTDREANQLYVWFTKVPYAGWVRQDSGFTAQPGTDLRDFLNEDYPEGSFDSDLNP